jgi:hypothetical protein
MHFKSGMGNQIQKLKTAKQNCIGENHNNMPGVFLNSPYC